MGEHKCPKCGKEMTFKYETKFYHRDDGSIFERSESSFGCFADGGCGYYYDD